MSAKPIATAILIAAAALPLAGCIHGKSHSSISGDYVGSETFRRIQVGKTTDSWVLATMGPPTRKSPIEGGELWAYEYERVDESEGGIFLIVGGSDYDETAGGTYIEIKDGIVTDAWRD